MSIAMEALPVPFKDRDERKTYDPPTDHDMSETAEAPVEAIKPTDWRKRIRLAALLVMLFLSAMTLFQRWLYTSPRFAMQKIVISGHHYVLEQDVLKIVNTPLQTNLFTIPIGQLQKVLAVNPRLKSVQVARSLPDQLAILLEERLPALLIKAGDTFYEVDREGVILPPVGVILPDLPMLSGLSVENLAPGDRIGDPSFFAALGIVEKMEAIQAGWSNEISEIYVVSPEEITIYTMMAGQTLQLSSSNYAAQLERFRMVTEKMGREREQIRAFDLRYTDQVVIKN